MRATLEQPDVQSGITQQDRQHIQEAVNAAANWLDENQEASKDEYMSHTKSIEAIAHPILSEYYKKKVLQAPHEPNTSAQQDDEAQNDATSQPQTEDVD